MLWTKSEGIFGFSIEFGSDCGATVPATRKVLGHEGRRDARTTNFGESSFLWGHFAKVAQNEVFFRFGSQFMPLMV